MFYLMRHIRRSTRHATRGALYGSVTAARTARVIMTHKTYNKPRTVAPVAVKRQMPPDLLAACADLQSAVARATAVSNKR